MTEVPARVVVEGEQTLILRPRPQLIPGLASQSRRRLDALFTIERGVDSRREDGGKRNQIGIGARVRLHVGMLGAE